MTEQASGDRATDGKAHAVASDKLRETAKWIVGGAFAALVVILGGTSLSSIGLLFTAEPDWVRIIVAGVAAATGLAFLVRLTLDALDVLTFEQFSLPQYGFGVIGNKGEPAEVEFPTAFGSPDDAACIATVRERVERQHQAYWPPRIDTLEKLARLEIAAYAHRDEQPLEGSEITFLAPAAAITATQSGEPVVLPGSGPYHVDIAGPGKLVVSGTKDLLRYDIIDNRPRISAVGEHAVTRADIDWFAAAAYNSALFNRVSITFERLQRRLPFNVAVIAAAFVLMIAAINPPEAEDGPVGPPVVSETSVMQYDAAGNQLRRQTTTRTLEPEQVNNPGSSVGDAQPTG